MLPKIEAILAKTRLLQLKKNFSVKPLKEVKAEFWTICFDRNSAEHYPPPYSLSHSSEGTPRMDGRTHGRMERASGELSAGAPEGAERRHNGKA